MEFKKNSLKKNGVLRSPDMKLAGWLAGRFVVGRYSYSRKNILAVFFGLILALLCFSFLFSLYANYRANPDLAKQREIRFLTRRIGRFMDLPQGEQPTLATVTDKGKLKGQDFFVNARNGDKLLIYPQTGKAILFRPLTQKIIEVTNLTSASRSDCEPQEANPQP